MVDLRRSPARPLRRGIPGTPYFIELSASAISVKVRGSRRPGVSLALMEVIGRLSVPDKAPAKFHGEPIAYLQWAASKVRKKRKKTLRPSQDEAKELKA